LISTDRAALTSARFAQPAANHYSTLRIATGYYEADAERVIDEKPFDGSAGSANRPGSRRSRMAGDEGIGMILVLGYAMIITILIAVSVGVVNSTTRSGASHVQYGQAVDSAEAGVDQTLARVTKNANYSPAGSIIPAQWLNGFPDATTERAWVLATANSVLASNPALLQQTAQGEFLALRPVNVQRIYSIGWQPSRANPKRVRVLRNDYIFSGYTPTDAILATGNVSLGGSFSLASNAGTALPPSVHTEGLLTKCSASVSVPDGTVFGSVGGSGGCGTPETSQTVPQVDPRALYTADSGTYASQWYDLCPDGTARQPSSAPCLGTPVGGTRGWSWSSSSSTWSTSGPQSGIYYVYQANADLTAAGTPQVTVITEANNNLSCPRVNGDIHVKQTQLIPALPFVSLFSGGSVNLDSQAAVGDANHPGLVATQGHLTMTTSSSPGIVGAVVTNNLCNTADTFQGSQITFDANMNIRLPGLIRSTAQTELN
jgi:hypothetical protein